MKKKWMNRLWNVIFNPAKHKIKILNWDIIPISINVYTVALIVTGTEFFPFSTTLDLEIRRQTTTISGIQFSLGKAFIIILQATLFSPLDLSVDYLDLSVPIAKTTEQTKARSRSSPIPRWNYSDQHPSRHGQWRGTPKTAVNIKGHLLLLTSNWACGLLQGS